ncbi:MAG: NmrA/HSCARG family protein [Burkholderiaceae bacterium]
MTKKVITIFGATGAQGGALARAILSDPASEFAVRAITRKPQSDAAHALSKLGADVVAGDLDDAASVGRAMAGGYGAFCVTNFWEHFSPDKELAQAKTMAQAAAAAKLQHVVWSTLEDSRKFVVPGSGEMPVLMGKYNVPHFDAKGEANQFFVASGVPTTMLYTSFYWENLIYFGMAPTRGPDGKLSFALPMADKKLPGIAVQDIGKCTYGIFKRGTVMLGKSVGIAGEHLTGTQMAQQLIAAYGEPVTHNALTPAQYRALGFPGADDLGNMFEFNRDFEDAFCAKRSLSESRALNPELLTFGAWLAANKSQLPKQ